jgi:hypothetical protein
MDVGTERRELELVLADVPATAIVKIPAENGHVTGLQASAKQIRRVEFLLPWWVFGTVRHPKDFFTPATTGKEYLAGHGHS